MEQFGIINGVLMASTAVTNCWTTRFSQTMQIAQYRRLFMTLNPDKHFYSIKQQIMWKN